jgi:hypothetical protein
LPAITPNRFETAISKIYSDAIRIQSVCEMNSGITLNGFINDFSYIKITRLNIPEKINGPIAMGEWGRYVLLYIATAASA